MQDGGTRRYPDVTDIDFMDPLLTAREAHYFSASGNGYDAIIISTSLD